jgi:N-methylhydantoinase A
MVDENMASAARVHAVERGKSLDERTLVAFGGAAPLHATRIADKLGIDRIVVPTGAGVGSAVGMLAASIAYEVARSLYQRVRELDPAAVNAHIAAMRQEASAVVERSAGHPPLVESRTAYMRYVGQGHEIAVRLEPRALEATDRERLQEAFEREYRVQFGRTIPRLDAEVLSWALSISTQSSAPKDAGVMPKQTKAEPSGRRSLVDPQSGELIEALVFRRKDLQPGAYMRGPALIVENETTTVVGAGFDASVNAVGYLVLERRL